jgi:Holliday junction resolvase RusA-like endonuclease
LVSLENKEINSHFFKAIILDNLTTYYKNKDYLTTTIFFKDEKRFLIFEYYFENKKLVKIKVRELNSEFQWDMINFNEFYYNDNKIVYRKFYQSLMDGQFGLDIKFDDTQLKVMAFKILSDIKK